MGSFFVDLLSFDHETAVYDIDAKRLRFMYNTQRFTSMDEIDRIPPRTGHQCRDAEIYTGCLPASDSPPASRLYPERYLVRQNGIQGVL